MPTSDLDDMTVQVRGAVEAILAVPNQTDRLWGVMFDFALGSRAEDELLALRQRDRTVLVKEWVSAAEHVLERLWARQGMPGIDKYIETLRALAGGVVTGNTLCSTEGISQTNPILVPSLTKETR